MCFGRRSAAAAKELHGRGGGPASPPPAVPASHHTAAVTAAAASGYEAGFAAAAALNPPRMPPSFLLAPAAGPQSAATAPATPVNALQALCDQQETYVQAYSAFVKRLEKMKASSAKLSDEAREAYEAAKAQAPADKRRSNVFLASMDTLERLVLDSSDEFEHFKNQHAIHNERWLVANSLLRTLRTAAASSSAAGTVDPETTRTMAQLLGEQERVASAAAAAQSKLERDMKAKEASQAAAAEELRQTRIALAMR
jgi:hypothetical protein